MGYNNYIVAIEISSSKISGAVSIETFNGTKILAATSVPVDGFISRGTVRNVDSTSNAINSIINQLENKLDDNVSIKKAYVSLAGLTMHSIPSKVSKCFDTYTKITPEIISGMECDNEDLFQTPEGYSKVTVITQEYKMDGKTERNPIGIPAMNIEGNYLNIVVKKQYLDQLEESFKRVDVEIDSFIAARMEADIRLTKDERQNGCALTDIGAETTTISIYKNGDLRKLIVLPIGSMNITRDLCSANISMDEAEEIKFTRGYKSPSNDKAALDNETINQIIGARYGEILQNVKYQIEESAEPVQHIVFIGGGSKLKNFDLLVNEYLPDFNVIIKPNPEFNLQSAPGVNTDNFSATLYGLLNKGNENCCEKEMPKQAGNNSTLFPEEAILFPQANEEVEAEIKENDTLDEERRRREEERIRRIEEEKVKKEEERKRKEEEKRRKEEERRLEKERKKKEKEEMGPGLFGTIWDKIGKGAKEFVNGLAGDDEESYNEEQ